MLKHVDEEDRVELFGARLKGLGIVALDDLVETVAVAGDGRLGGHSFNGHQPGMWAEACTQRATESASPATDFKHGPCTGGNEGGDVVAAGILVNVLLRGCVHSGLPFAL